ncbi:unnamed protein product [Rhizoctonia solani]|uniref:Uncharacterized protein n=1 Tax=Rhizoctonia solani TaxID=456999 RepID=A0A8H3A1Y5_9AGAM|nr:hypothetical protein RHS04_08361 [Rhizoctonia solani]CAE6397611.1 unnamed protein product [Rhizoctonia solani]
MIHFAHAPEFGIHRMAVEGLAQAAVHDASLRNMIERSLMESNAKPEVMPSDRVHSFSILSRILMDDQLKAGAACSKDTFVRSMEAPNNVGGIVREYASLWTIKEDENDIQARLEELDWLVALLFGVGGWKKNVPFRAHLYIAHMVTSCLFLPSVMLLLKPAHQIDLMRACFANVLVCFIGEGRPALEVQGFFDSVTTKPTPKGDSDLATKSINGNPWYLILAHVVHYQDEHLVKAVRAPSHSASLYGTRPKGYFGHTELRGAEYIDGTLFIRTAGLLTDAMDWHYEVTKRVEGIDEGNRWCRDGLGWD